MMIVHELLNARNSLGTVTHYFGTFWLDWVAWIASENYTPKLRNFREWTCADEKESHR